ncbi:MAG: pepN [Gammaproteobacteria bacterium]|jgi:aminopeptidase N|nr:pepN [Gammaproteobacteria bacterium]
MTKQSIHRKDYLPSAFLIDEVQLEFELDPAHTRVINTMWIRRNPHVTELKPLVLNGENIHLEKIYLNGLPLNEHEYFLTDTCLEISEVPDSFELCIINTCQPDKNTALEGLYVSSGNFCTQCEPHGFRKITYYIDRPDVMAKFTTSLIADAKHYPVLLSNGNCVSEQLLDNGRKKVIWEDPFKKPCYLFALVAGKLDCLEDEFITHSQRKIALKIFVEKGNRKRAHHAMEMLKLSMRWEEENYGREYDLDIFMIVAVSDFNMGAMENKGLNIFNAKYILADPETATDYDYEGVATVVAHEYFHNWTGNRITCRDWFQLSLKEGLTVYRDQSFTGDITSIPVARIDDVRALTTAQFAEDAGPLAHPVRPDSYVEMNNFYTATVYNKGAEVVRMLANLTGEDGFRKGMDLYFDRYDGMAVTCDDFVQAHADANERDFNQFMYWYSQAGTPTLTFTDSFDSESKKYFLTVEQHTPPSADGSLKEAFHLPIKFGLYDRESRRLVREGLLELKDFKATFAFENLSAKPIPSLMRGFSAPVKWRYPYSLQDRIFLLKNDQDDFNRFEMHQQIFNDFFAEFLTADLATVKIAPDYLEALMFILQSPQIDDLMKSRLLSLPSYHALVERQKLVQVDPTIKAREKIVREIAKYLAAEAHELFIKLNQHSVPYSFNARDVGQRALKQTCLFMLCEGEHPEAIPLAKKLYIDANNMTDRFNAIHLLVQYADNALREEVLQDFYQRFKGNALVMEKWLALQAGRSEKDTLQKVKLLTQSPVFDIKNPNKARALIGTYGQNFVAFHLSNGEGYEWLAEQVLALDKINPQISARLVQPLTQWNRYEDKHAVLMRSSLQYISTHQLSNDLAELVNKSL